MVNKKMWRWIAPVLIFAGSLFFSRWFWPTLTFPDGDSFYHIKITELLAGGIVRDFPWLPFTVLSDTYIDHHFLYHIFLFPFIKIAGPFVGMKIATVLLVAFAALTFYFVLRRLQFKMPLFFTALLFTAPGFMFRLHLAKAPPFSLIFILLGVLFLVKRRSIALAALSFFYVWAYGGWPLLPFVATLWVLSRIFITTFFEVSGKRYKTFFSAFGHQEYLRPLLGIATGSLAGLIINPYFPTNLLFYWFQFVQIGVVNYGSKIGVGAEWYSTSFFQLIGHNAIIFVCFVFGVTVFVLEARRRAMHGELSDREPLLRTFAFTVLALVFFLLTVRFRRMIDVFIPFAVLATAALVTLAWPSARLLGRRFLVEFARPFRRVMVVSAVAVLFVFFLLPTYSLFAHRNMLIERYDPQHFAGAFMWIKDHVPAGSTHFHDRWDIFPVLFYSDDRLRYITGLDSTFFYLKDKEKYELWRRLVAGEYAGDVSSAIREGFGAEYVLLTKKENLFELQLTLGERARLVYADSQSKIFLLLAPTD